MDGKLFELKLAILEAIVFKLLILSKITDEEYEKILIDLRERMKIEKIDYLGSLTKD